MNVKMGRSGRRSVIARQDAGNGDNNVIFTHISDNPTHLRPELGPVDSNPGLSAHGILTFGRSFPCTRIADDF